MKNLSYYRNQELTLVQPSLMKRECELVSPDGVLIKAYFPKWHKGEAVIEGFGGKWIVRKPSIWRSDIEVCKEGYNYPVAKYVGSAFMTSGTIELPRGVRLKFEYRVFKGIYTIFTDTSEELLVIKHKRSLKKKAVLTMGRKTDILDEYPWLPLLVWYIMIQNQNHSIAGIYY